MEKHLKIFIFFFIFLGTIFALQQAYPYFSKKTNTYFEKVKKLKAENINFLTISKGQETVKLQKEENLWKVLGKKADQGKVEELLTYLLVKKPPEIVAQTEKKYQEFELTSESATTVSLEDKIKIILGKTAPFGGTYSRLEEGKEVYLLPNLSSYYFSTQPSFWMDTTIVSVDRAKLKKIEFIKGKEVQSFILQENQWKEEKTGKTINQEKIESLISSLSPLKAESIFLSENKETTYQSFPQLILSLEEEQKEQLRFYQGKNDYKVKREKDNEEFKVSSFIADKFIKFEPF